MKKLALLLSLLVLMSALCIPAFAQHIEGVTWTAVAGNPDEVNFNYVPTASHNVRNYIEGLGGAGQTGALEGNVRAMYDDEKIYFRAYFASGSPKEFSVWLRWSSDTTYLYRIQKDGEVYNVGTTGLQYVTNGTVDTFNVQTLDNGGMLIDMAVTPPVAPVKGEKVQFEVSAVSANGGTYCMVCLDGTDSTGDFRRKPRAFGEFIYGDALPTLDVDGNEEMNVMVSTKTPDAVYSATVTWGAMQFVYDPEVEGADAWTANGNTVTVTNEGTRAIDVDVAYAAETNYTNITGSFDKNDVTLQPVYLVGENNNEATFTLTLSGELLNAYAGVKVGTVEVTLNPAA